MPDDILNKHGLDPLSARTRLSDDSYLRRVWSNGKVVSTFRSIYTADETVRRTDAMLGRPFEQLPGNPAQHQVIGELHDGSKVRVRDVETVYNDWVLAQYINGDGAYEESYRNDIRADVGRRQLEVLELAIRLYGRVQ